MSLFDLFLLWSNELDVLEKVTSEKCWVWIFAISASWFPYVHFISLNTIHFLRNFFSLETWKSRIYHLLPMRSRKYAEVRKTASIFIILMPCWKRICRRSFNATLENNCFTHRLLFYRSRANLFKSCFKLGKSFLILSSRLYEQPALALVHCLSLVTLVVQSLCIPFV